MSWSPSALMKRATTDEAFGPPISEEELRSNLTVLENKLNKQMICVAGKNQVYIRSLLTGRGTTKPRIALKCQFRRDIGQDPTVFYEYIRDVCCSNPDKCPAYRAFRARVEK